MRNTKGEHGKKTSRMDLPQPSSPIATWDFSEKAVPGKVEPSEPNFMIHAFAGRSFEQRGVLGTNGLTVPRLQQFHVKVPKV